VHLAWRLCGQGRYEEARDRPTHAQAQEGGREAREVPDLVARETTAGNNEDEKGATS
jgi:hypothetical protein